MQRTDFHIEIPDELIAQFPSPNRSGSRLLVLNGDEATDEATNTHRNFTDLPSLLQAGDRLVFNNTRVIPARLFGRKASGGKVEILLERFAHNSTALVKIRASKSPSAGQQINIHDSANDETVAVLEVIGRQEDLFEIRCADGGSIAEVFERVGQVPLPPYIERSPDAADAERYQTIYAAEKGAVAAPTAGLHFTPALMDELSTLGIDCSFITLHVGAGTFQPVRVDDIGQHVMHAERYSLDETVVAEIEQTRARGGRIIAVGTTSVRTLESAAREALGSDECSLLASNGIKETRLFIKPGDPFHIVDGMITNFHLPESTLLMLVCAFAGTDKTLSAYRQAVAQRYRFYSYGDAMLVWPDQL